MSQVAAGTVSAWVQRWSHLVPQTATVLDVACGSGRHVGWFVRRGAQVTGVDRDAAVIDALRAEAGIETELVVADIEQGPWPLADRRFDVVLVTNYLWRPLLPTLVESVADGGLLIYETFADGHQAYGRPTNPNYLLRPGELLEVSNGLVTIAYEHGLLDDPPRFIQRIVARRGNTPARLKSADSEEPA